MERFWLFLAIFVLASCTPEADYNRGYDDGSVVGYNSLCYPRASNIIAGDWNNTNYSEGYADGEADGRAECRAEQRQR